MNGTINGGRGLKSRLVADINLAELDSASWSDTTYTVNGVPVEVVNSARMDTIGPNGTTGVVLESKSGTSHESNARDTGRMEVDLSDLFTVGRWYLTTPMWVVAEWAVALDPGSAASRTVELGVDTGTGTGVDICSCRLVGDAGGAKAGGWRSLSSGDAPSATTVIAPTWLGILIEPVNVQAFAGTGAAPSAPLLADHLSPSAGLTATAAQNPGYFTVEAAQAATRNVFVAVAGNWTTAPILRRIRAYTIGPA